MENFTLCRSGDHLLVSASISSIQDGIDAQSGESLADLDGYKEGIKALPDGAMLTMYMDMAKYQENLSPLISMAYGPGITDLLSESSSAASVVTAGVSVVDVGVKFDYAMITDADLQVDLPEEYFNDDPQIASLAPEDTVLYFSSGIVVENLEQTKASLLELLGSQGTDAEEAMMLLTMAFGFDPIEDLIGNLDGEFALLLLPSAEGILAESAEIPLGFAILAETAASDELLDVADKFSAAMESQGVGVAEVSEEEYGTIYNLVDMYYGDLIATYGVGDDYFMIGSSSGTLEDIFSGGPSLAASDDYKDARDAFPRNVAPVMYINIQGLIGQIKESMEPWEREDFNEEAGEVLNSLQYLALAKKPNKDNIVRSMMILFIEMD